MKIKKDQIITFEHERKGRLVVKACGDFDTEEDKMFPVKDAFTNKQIACLKSFVCSNIEFVNQYFPRP